MTQLFRSRRLPPPQSVGTHRGGRWRVALAASVALLVCGAMQAQDAPRSAPVPPANPAKEPLAPTGSPAAEPAPDQQPSAQAAPATPEPPKEAESLRKIINSLKQSDIQEAISALRANYIDQKALTEEELNRAALEGLLARLDHGAILEVENNTPPAPAVPFHAEVLDGRVGYIRLGALSAESLQQLDAALKTASERAIPAVALDLRGTPESSDYALAEQVVSRFATKGQQLFSINRPGAKQEQMFTSKRDPAYTGFVVALVDADTAGAAEAVAGAIRLQSKSLVVGEVTEGRAVEYSNVQLSNGRLMRVATGMIVLPPGTQIFPDGITPDLIVSMPAADLETIFRQSTEKGMSQFVFETERPRLNEAALVAGTNPSIDAYQQARRNPNFGKGPLRDTVLQRALDVVTSIQVIEFKTGLPKKDVTVIPESAPTDAVDPAAVPAETVAPATPEASD